MSKNLNQNKGMKKIDKKQEQKKRREELKKISQPIKKLVKKGELENINQGLKNIYAQQGHTILKPLKQWNKEGKRVKKGEKALLLWGSPTRIKKEQKEKDHTEENDKLDFYPLCFVFSNLQLQEEGGAR